MNGAESIIRAARAGGVEVCFANPGTTELPLVAALDTVEGIRAVLCLFEGVCTGAADGYARMAGKPAMALLHLGPGLANGTANLHNARRAHTPIVTVVGDHPAWHRKLDPPLAMEIETMASAVSGWQRTCTTSGLLARDMADAIAAAREGQVATLVVPFDLQTELSGSPVQVTREGEAGRTGHRAIDDVLAFLRGHARPALVLGGRALSRGALLAAARIRNACGCSLLAEAFPARMERGAGLPDLARIPYFPEAAMEMLKGYDAFVLAGAREPVAFFGYRDGPGSLLRDDQARMHLAGPGRDAARSLISLAEALGAPAVPSDELLAGPSRPGLPQGPLDGQKACAVLAALQPVNAVVVDESITNGVWYYPLTAGLPPFTLLTLTGGSLGQGPACAVGASMACPDRKVIDLQADGAGMYTVQALWTQAQEGLDITTLVFSNRSYDILKVELARHGVRVPGPVAARLTDLAGIDWVSLGRGMGVDSTEAGTCEVLARELERSFAEKGPHLIQMNLPMSTEITP
ncbi:MAG TPA: acetolactate synthase large subunit [Deltaproteobacteria bacterium]|nr:acetolactate synthase large subunit [Deltaproteobacteria bacterium]HPR55405.1 acetolactate synthase large subunit [Deltaproteobacteria bacterium]HXK48155.1 acetolactate synthase large subunit [Deltaproteobacteria bacterium]